MKNFVQEGDVIAVPAPYTLASGDGALVGSLFGIASHNAIAGASVELQIEGVVRLSTLATDTGAVGTKMYWDNTNRRATVTAAGNSLIGALTFPKGAGDSLSFVRLNGTTV